MLCATCNVEVPSSFKHAIAKNECPSCGGILLDEEMMAIIEDIGKTVASEVTLREEAVKKIAMAIATQYNVSLRGELRKEVNKPKTPVNTAKQVEKTEVIEVPEVDENITSKERETIMEEVIKNKYSMVDQTSVSLDETKSKYPDSLESPDIFNGTENMFGDTNNVLEQERIMRMTKQKQALESGSGGFRRSS